MEYTRSSTVGEVEVFETFRGDVKEIVELNKALASHKALTFKSEVHVSESTNESGTANDVEEKIDEFTQWKTEIAKLAKRNVDIGLLKELNDLGPKSVNEILALNSLSDEEFDEYCGLYREKEKLSFEQFNMI
ncbi:hypothetical protein V2H29_00660 [Lysinibacillus fusiformis]|uniref:hypothetical protein n=1 Tax=Lysinibacillus fusiformis TaxID=28031 RepID=UPI002EC04C95|nr:hypothetical protein [Lysinibacillus fusiformis]